MIVPLIVLVLAGSAASGLAWRINASLDRMQELTTPEPEVSSSVLGGTTEKPIDTGPARQALTAEAERVAPTSPLAEPTAEPTVRPPTAASTGTAPTEAVAPTAGPSGLAQAEDAPSATGDARPPAEPSADSGATEQAATSSDSPTGESVTILLMGVDAEAGTPIDTGTRPDALSVLHLDRATGTCRMLAIPRDTRVDLPGYGLSKVNHALALGGIPYEQLVVSQYLGIPIDHYGLIDFAGVVSVVDRLGGVVVDNQEAFTIGGYDFPLGPQTLNGEEALLYARYRGGTGGDLGRIERQQEILRVLIDQATNRDLVTMIPDLLPTLEDHSRTDLGLEEMLDLARDFGGSCTGETLETETLPGEIATFRDPLLEMDLSYIVVEDADLRRGVRWLLGK